LGRKKLDSLISTASTSFASTTGFGWDALVTWAGSIMKLVLGASLGLVDSMLQWIIAIVIISAIIGLIYHALRWLHILR